MAGFAGHWGWRKNEILSLTWDEIDEAGGVIRLRDNLIHEQELLDADDQFVAYLAQQAHMVARAELNNVRWVSPTAGTWSSSQWRPDNEFETDRVEAFKKRTRNCSPCVRSLVHSPEAVIHSPAEIIAAWPTAVTRSRWPRALIRSTQKPVSGLWKVTRSTRPTSTSRPGAAPRPPAWPAGVRSRWSADGFGPGFMGVDCHRRLSGLMSPPPPLGVVARIVTGPTRCPPTGFLTCRYDMTTGRPSSVIRLRILQPMLEQKMLRDHRSHATGATQRRGHDGQVKQGEQEVLHARDSVGQTSGATQRCLNPGCSERIGNSRRTGARRPMRRAAR